MHTSKYRLVCSIWNDSISCLYCKKGLNLPPQVGLKFADLPPNIVGLKHDLPLNIVGLKHTFVESSSNKPSSIGIHVVYHLSTQPHGKHANHGNTHTHASMLKHKTYLVFQAKIAPSKKDA